jgi:hypothetical protein
MYLDGNLAPIGWSRNGYFAYAEYMTHADSFGEVKWSTVYVINIITDKIVEYITNATTAIEIDDSFSEFWQKEENKITILLQKYNIVSFPDIEIQNMDTLWQQFGLEIEYVDINYEGEDIHDDYEERHHTNIYIRNNRGQRKKIGEAGNLYASGTAIGYYKSPFENRLVFYIRTKFFGGPEISEEYYRFIGCHITAGF